MEEGGLRALFPRDEPPRWTRREIALAGLVVVVALVAPLARHRGAPVLDTVWAEDGRFLLQEALILDARQALPRTFAGYIHVVPRLAVEFATLFPIDAASELLVLIANALTALSALAVFVASRTHLGSPWIRAVMALAVPLTPSTGVEVLSNLANAQWPLLFASFWLLLWRPATIAGVVASSLLLVGTALSAGLSVLLLPLAVLGLLVRPFGRSQLPTWLFCSAVALQLFAAQPQAHLGHSAWAPLALVASFGQRVGIVALAGHRIGGSLWARFAWRWLAVVAILFLAVLVVGVLLHTARTRWLVLLYGGYAFAFFAATAVLRGAAPGMLWQAGTWHENGARYAYVPVLLVYSMVAAVLDRRPAWLPRPLLTVARAGSLVLLLLVMLVDFRLPDLRTKGPPWSEKVHRARVACAASDTREVIVPIAPARGDWTVAIPCRELHPKPG